MGSLIVLTLVLLLVCWIPIANIGFFAGYYRSLLKTMRGGKSEVGDLFNAWDCFGQLFLLIIIVGIPLALVGLIPILGWIVIIVAAFFVAPAPYAVVDKGLGAIDALKWGIGAFKANIGNWILCIIVGGIRSEVGAIALGIGVIVTMPWGIMIILNQYESQKHLSFK